MAMTLAQRIRKRLRAADLFTLCLAGSLTIHGVALAAYLISQIPRFAADEVIDADALNLKNVDLDVDALDIPPELFGGSGGSPAPVEKTEWVEGTKKGGPDAADTDTGINAISGDGTDKDGYLFSDIGDHPPIPTIDFDVNRYFPAQARSANVTRKTVVLLVQVNEDGSLKGARVVSPPSDYGFDEAALNVLARIRFRAGRLNGRNVKMVHRMPINFELHD